MIHQYSSELKEGVGSTGRRTDLWTPGSDVTPLVHTRNTGSNSDKFARRTYPDLEKRLGTGLSYAPLSTASTASTDFTGGPVRIVQTAKAVANGGDL